MSQSVQSLAAPMLQHLRQTVSDDCYRTLFQDLTVLGIDGNSMRVGAPNRYVKHWVENQYKKDLLRAVASLRPEITEIELCLALPVKRPSDTSSALSQVVEDVVRSVKATEELRSFPGTNGSHIRLTQLSPAMRLEFFTVGKCNRLPHAAAQSVVESPGAVYNPLYIHGSQGLGKTHILQGIAHLLGERNPKLRVLCLSCEEFTNAYISAVQNKQLDTFRSRFRSCDALLVDDVQFLAGREKTQEEFLHTFDALRQSNKQVVVTADLPPREIKRLDARLVTRFHSGLAARLDAPDVAVRVELLREKAKGRGIALAPDVADILASHIDSNVRELEGAVCKVMALAASEKKAPDRDTAVRALSELGYLRSGPLTLKDILAALEQRYQISQDDIRSGKRHASLVHARHVGMYLSKLLTSHSVAEIGRFYGNRDHATVLHAAKKMSELLKRDDNFKNELQILRRLLGH